MIGTTLRTVAGLNRELRTLFTVTLLFRAGLMAFPFLSAYLLIGGAYSPVDVGLIIGAFGLGALLADISASVLLGRIPARTVMVTGLLLHTLVLALVPALHGVGVLAAATFAWGFTFEIYTPASYSQIIDRSSPEERKVAFACNRLAINVGMGIGPVLGGLIFALAPVSLFWINAACVLGATAYLLAGTRRGGVAEAAARSPRRMIASTVREETRFWTIFGLSLPIHLAYALPPVLVSAYLIQGLGLPSYWVSVVFVVNAGIVILFEVPLNKAMDSLSHSRSLLIGYAAAGTGFAAMGLSSSPAVIVGATVLWTVGEMIVFPSLLSYVSDLSGRDIADRNMSLYSGGVSIGVIAAPAASLALTTHGGPATPWLVIGAIVLAAFALLAAARLSTYTWRTPAEDPAPALGS
ncbi:Predicted arabinose efflux permease, MFS family [Amycolatopsis xylanica]|uniref:Predicted arabinose efflux permease, MFS family n=1 Tax=Amycolatopsis xylanica TaxID=589385 RepID=A0A1H2TYY2_9PSEU|nr:MFS transporter [Amycolatopsis xylanica]SDW49142.1 Predicted arabinose efflux permease, MFS family [Amycolatopsis xylanica]